MADAPKVKIEKPADWFDKVLPAKVAANPQKTGGFTGNFSFKITGERGGEWTASIDANGCQVKTGMDPDPKFTITMKDDDFVKLMNGELNGQMAFMSGKLKFKGSMGTAMKLQGLLF